MPSRVRSVLLLAAALVLLAACGSTDGSDGGPPAAGAAFAAISVETNAVQLVSATTGKNEGRVAPASHGTLSVMGVARIGASSWLVTYATGPRCTSDVAGCGPVPDTCGGLVERIDEPGDRARVVWSVPADEQVDAAVANPEGTQLAAVVAPCVPSYFNAHLVVHDLSAGTSWTIGDRVPRCHILGTPAWTSDGAHLLVPYAPPTGVRPYSGPDGTCSAPGAAGILELDAHRDAPTFTGAYTAPPAGCADDAVAVGPTSTYAVEGCGPDRDQLQGPAQLVRLDDRLRTTGHWGIGDCTDGNSLAVDAQGTVFLSAYLFCNPPLHGAALGDPVTVVDRLDGQTLTRVTSSPGGTLAYRSLAA